MFAARATLEILIPDFVKQTSEEKPVEGDELEVLFRFLTFFFCVYFFFVFFVFFFLLFTLEATLNPDSEAKIFI